MNMLFQKNIVKKYLSLLNEEQTQEAWNVYIMNTIHDYNSLKSGYERTIG